MVDYGRLAIPAILILAVGGVISFFLAYNFYPEKHENVTVDGKISSSLSCLFLQLGTGLMKLIKNYFHTL
jgi:hypothetical protein